MEPGDGRLERPTDLDGLDFVTERAKLLGQERDGLGPIEFGFVLVTRVELEVVRQGDQHRAERLEPSVRRKGAATRVGCANGC